MTWGEAAEKLYTAAVGAGREPPESSIAPDLPDHLICYLEAFWLLSSCRYLGPMGVGPIPWTAIDKYAERMNIRDEILYDDLVAHITAMDQVYLRVQRETIEREQNKSSGKPSKKSGGGAKSQSSHW